MKSQMEIFKLGWNSLGSDSSMDVMIFCANFVGTLFINIFQPSFNLFPAPRVWRGTNAGPSLSINLATLARGEILRNIGPTL